jgi:hypothetical protein
MRRGYLDAVDAHAHERSKTFSPPMECHMKIQSAIATLVLGAVLTSPMFTPAFAQNSQQTKMADCNKQAGDKKGDDRKVFMKTCLSSKPAAAPMTQQEKMKACNTQATGKKGDDRKAFMKSCLSSAPAN